jgi:hypothetical protein
MLFGMSAEPSRRRGPSKNWYVWQGTLTAFASVVLLAYGRSWALIGVAAAAWAFWGAYRSNAFR